MNALTEILSHRVVYKLGWTLLHLLWQAGVVAMLLAILLRLLRRASANLRYIVACTALAMVVVLPVVTIQLIQAPAPYSAVRAESASALSPQVETEEIVLLMPLAPIQAPAIPLKLRAVALLEPALPYIVAAWLLGVLTLSIRHLGGWAHLQRLKRRIVKEADAALIETLSALAAKLKVTRPVQLAESALVQIPAVVGWLRPVILLPASALTGLTAQQLEALLAHELAHIRRYDYLVNMLQTVIEILGFYHPAVWWVSHKIRDERENCCDDLAVNVCGDKMRYARALAEMERIRSSQPEFALAANGGNLFTRICRLIGKGSAPKPRFNWAAALIAAILILALAIPTTLAISRRRSTGTADNAAAARAPDANNIPPAPPVYVTDANETRVQTLFEFKIFQVPKDSKLIKDADSGNVFVRSDKAFADELETLSKESKDARVLTAPRVITLEGEEAVMFVGNDMPYTAGYTEQPGKGPKPIMKTVHGGYKIRVKAEVVDNTNIRTDFIFTQTDPTFTTHKVARGQEIQIPVIKTTECSAVVTTGNGATIFIGGLQDAEKPNQTIIIQLTPHIIRAGQTIPADDSPPNKGSKEEISFTVAPQVVTSIRVDTLDAQAFPSSRPEPASVVEELIAMVKGQAPHSFELLNTQVAVAEKLKDLRTVLAEQPVEIESVLADDKEALVTSTTVKDDRNREGQLLFHLTKQEDKWLIDDIDFETPDTLKEELTRFQKRSEASKSSRRRPEPARVVEELIAMVKGQAPHSFELLNTQVAVAEQLKDLRTILGEQPVEIESVLADDKEALVTSTTVKDDRNREGQLLFHLTKQEDKWLIDDIDFETPDTLKEELTRFQKRSEASKISRRRLRPADNNSQATEDKSIMIFKLRYADCREASDMLHPLLVDMQGAAIVPDTNSNQLIINATEADLKRIADLIQKIDVAEIGRAQSGPSDIVVEIFPLKYAACEQVALLLDELTGLSDEIIKIVADSRMNQVIVQASESEIEQISNLIRQLDQPIGEETAKERQVLKTEELDQFEARRGVGIRYKRVQAAGSTSATPPQTNASRTFSLRYMLANEMADDLRQILLGRFGMEARPAPDNMELTVTAPPDVLNRVSTFFAVADWPNRIARGANLYYPRESVELAARSFFYACSIQDTEGVALMLSPGLLAELNGTSLTAHGVLGEEKDAELVRQLRGNWPGKEAAVQKVIQAWNRFPLRRLRAEHGVAIGFGLRYFATAAFEGAPEERTQLSFIPDRTGGKNGPLMIDTLPPWLPASPEREPTRTKPTPGTVLPTTDSNSVSSVFLDNAAPSGASIV
jgi:beta-lactamase regulating signal transducer with metallopeptidase domain/type II secretory pathway component GspD/PulD (secretin)